MIDIVCECSHPKADHNGSGSTCTKCSCLYFIADASFMECEGEKADASRAGFEDMC